MKLKQTWRWFGPQDPVALQYVLQAGAEGIVTALHHIPHGEVWSSEEINQRKDEIQRYGLSWDVVESLPVHESIKTQHGNFQHYIDLYKQSLKNLAACGIKIVTYNFMPVNDWTRTDLGLVMPDGSKALYFNWFDLAVFDIHLLKRENAVQDYTPDIIENAEKRYQQYTEAQLDQLIKIITFGIPGEDKLTLPQMREKLSWYKNIGRIELQAHLRYFLQEIAPVADELGIKLAIHPDDPPYNILGLPRIVSTLEDLKFILSAVPNESNGICLCTGSLGVNPKNNLIDIIKTAGNKIHFAHFRNVSRDGHGNFFEDNHLDGAVDMYAVMKEILLIQQQLKEPIPFRPDHGHQMMDDLDRTTNPGYSCIGRTRGLAELRGLQMGVLKNERMRE